MSTPSPAGRRRSQSVDAALDIIDVFRGEDAELGLSELGRRLGLPHSKVHRLLSTLKTRGYIAQDLQSRRYRLGLAFLELGSLVGTRLRLPELARPALSTLAHETGETAYLAVRDDGSVVFIDIAEGPRPIRLYSRIGGHLPAHCFATGKVLLAGLTAGELEDILSRGLPRHGPRTITDPAELRAQVAEIRARGWATTDAEWEAEVASIAAAIRDHRGQIVAAIGIAGPRTRVLAGTRPAVDSVRRAAGTVSAELGYSDTSRIDLTA